jgi:RimJ/RimL family protein N-acetyltransferase
METRFDLRDGRECLIRLMTERDLPQVISCINSVAEEKVYIASEGITDPERFRMQFWEPVLSGKFIPLVAEIDGKVVGSSTLQIGTPSKRKHTAYIGSQLVSEFRGLGIGTAMMRVATDIARENGIEKLHLSAFSSNERAIDFYKKCGFEVEAVLKRQFIIDGKYIDEVYMVRWL